MPQLITPKTPTGTLELLPHEQAAFQHMLDVIRKGYERFGFQPIETPVFEEVDVLLTKSGGDTEKQVYFVQSTGSLQQGHKPDLALRFDLTVPLARYVAEHQNDLAFPFRRYQIQRVYRGERAQKGRFREFYQCDIDIIGREVLSPAYDAEVPVIIASIFKELAIGAFTIHVSNRKILKGILEQMGVADAAQRAHILRDLDKADKIGWEKVAANIAALPFAPAPEQIKPLLALLEKNISNAEAVEALRAMAAGQGDAQEGLNEIELLLKATADMGVAAGVIRFNPAITRGLDYYTGTVYETFLNDHPDFGSICSGGRYEDLANYYTRSRLPGVGISIGATRLFAQMRDAGLIKNVGACVQVLVTMMDEALAGDCRQLATELRQAGIATALYLEHDKLGKQLKYADKAGMAFAAVMGSDEKARGVVALKNLKTGEQQDVPRDRLAAFIGTRF